MAASPSSAVVVGATSGIGAATVRVLVRRGMRVVAAGRRRERLDALSAEVAASGGEAIGVAGDVNAPGLMRELSEAARRRWGAAPHVFVLCAGHGLPGTIVTSAPERWRALVETNYLAMLHQLHDCAGLLAEPDRAPTDGPADIVVLGSTAGRDVSAANPVYGSTKFAVRALVESLRRELCAVDVRVSLVEPGFVKTEFQTTAGYDPAWFEGVERDVGPLLAAEDVARAIEFVVSQPPHVHVDTIRVRPARQAV